LEFSWVKTLITAKW